MRHFQKNTGIYFLFAVFIIGAYAGLRTAPVFGLETITIDAWGNEFAHYSSFGFLSTAFSATTSQSRVQIGNASPTVSGVTLNNGDPITLTGNATKTVDIGFTISDNNGCSDVFTNGTTSVKVFRHAVGSSCAADTRNCYTGRLLSNTCSGSNPSANATASVDLYYFADATDSSSSYDAQGWFAYVQASDLLGVASSATSTAVEVNTIVSIDVSSSTDYGDVTIGGNTSSTNQLVDVKNAGNASATLRVSGTALTSGANVIATSAQHYATSGFKFDLRDLQLQQTATDVSGFLLNSPMALTWGNTATLNNPLGLTGAEAYKHFIYLLGGGTSTGSFYGATTTVRYTSTTGSGALNSWRNTTAMPGPKGTHGVAVNGDFIYAIGGVDEAPAQTSSVFYARISSTGTISSWSVGQALPYNRYDVRATAYNNYLYVVGGNDDVAVTSSVLYASVNTSTGAVGTWTATNALPSAAARQMVGTNGRYIYSVGGASDGSNGTRNAFYAAINSNGTLGSWASTTPLATEYLQSQGALNQNILFLAGGHASNTRGGVPGNWPTSSVIFAPVHLNGTLGDWTTLASMASGTGNGSVVEANGYLYVMGGEDGAYVNTSTVTYAPINSRDTYWGISVSSTVPAGTYTGVNTFSAVWSQ